MRIFKLLSAVCAVAICADVISVRADDTPAQAAARAALMEKLNELNSETPQVSTNAPTPPPITNEAPQLMVTNEMAQPSQPEIAVTNAPMQTNLAAPSAIPPTAPEIPPTMTPSPAPQNFPGKNLGFQPIVAPPLPISPEKEAQLQALLERYEANQITPEQYQTQRAKILAEP